MLKINDADRTSDVRPAWNYHILVLQGANCSLQTADGWFRAGTEEAEPAEEWQGGVSVTTSGTSQVTGVNTFIVISIRNKYMKLQNSCKS